MFDSLTLDDWLGFFAFVLSFSVFLGVFLRLLQD